MIKFNNTIIIERTSAECMFTILKYLKEEKYDIPFHFNDLHGKVGLRITKRQAQANAYYGCSKTTGFADIRWYKLNYKGVKIITDKEFLQL